MERVEAVEKGTVVLNSLIFLGVCTQFADQWVPTPNSVFRVAASSEHKTPITKCVAEGTVAGLIERGE